VLSPVVATNAVLDVVLVPILAILRVLNTVLADLTVLKLETVGPSRRVRRIRAKIVVIALTVPDYLTILVDYFTVRADLMRLVQKIADHC